MARKLRLAPRIGALSIMVIAGAAHAEVELRADGSYRHDSNVFRLPEGQTSAPGSFRSDDVFNATATLGVTVHPADFDTKLQLSAGHDWYNRNSNLDNFNYSAQLSAQRDPGAVAGISVDALSQRTLSSFSDIRARLRNMQSLQRVTGEVSLPITPELRVVVDPEFTQSTNSAASIRANDYRQYGAGVGIGWFSPLGNVVAVTVTKRYTDGLRDRPVSLDGTTTVNSPINLSDTAVNLRLIYNPSVLTSISAELSYVDRNDRSVVDADYKGPSGSVTFNYHPSDTLSASVKAGRRLDAQSYIFIDSLRTDYVNAELRARLIDRVNVNLNGTFYHRRYRFDPTFGGGLTDRVEDTYQVGAGVEYLVLDRLNLGASALHEHRSSNVALGDYGATEFKLTATFRMGNSK